MHRVTKQAHIEPVLAALDLLPPGIRSRVEDVHVLSGLDPNFVGLHRFQAASYGRNYADVAHVTYDFHQTHMPRDRRATTLVLPGLVSIETAVHELGHVLDGALNFDHHAIKPIDWYAATNKWEAFAQSFAAWALPPGTKYDNLKDKLYETDRKTVDLFERLADA